MARPSRSISTSTTTRSRSTSCSPWTSTATRPSSARCPRPRPSRSSTRAAARSPTDQQQEPGAVELYVAALGFGAISVSVIAIAAVGFTMQFGITNMINLAYGEVMIVCAYVAYFFNHAGVSVWAALIVAALAGSVLSFLLNRFLYAPFQRKGTNLIGMVIVSLAASLMLANVLLAIVGYGTAAYEVDQGFLLRWNGF